MFVVVLLLTFLASRHVTAPSEIPLAHEDLGAYQLVSRVALVGDDGAVDEVGVRRALPPVGDLGQLGTGVVPRHLCLPLGSVVGVEERSDRTGNGKNKNYRYPTHSYQHNEERQWYRDAEMFQQCYILLGNEQ